MTDLILQDLGHPTRDRLAQILSDEKREMLGGGEGIAERRRTFNSLRLCSCAGSSTKVRKTRGKICCELKS
jgi:hypothetical protein